MKSRPCKRMLAAIYATIRRLLESKGSHCTLSLGLPGTFQWHCHTQRKTSIKSKCLQHSLSVEYRNSGTHYATKMDHWKGEANKHRLNKGLRLCSFSMHWEQSSESFLPFVNSNVQTFRVKLQNYVATTVIFKRQWVNTEWVRSPPVLSAIHTTPRF